MISKTPIFNWENFSKFIFDLYGVDEDEHFTVESPQGVLRRVDLDTDLFTGLFAYYKFGTDISMLIMDGRFSKPVRLMVSDSDWIRFNFALSITLDMDVVGSKPVNLDSPSWRIVDHPPDTTVTETPPAGAEARWVTIVCKRSVIEEITGRSTDDLPEFLRSVGADQFRSSLYRDFVIRSRLVSIASDIINMRIETPIYVPYMKARATELLCLALDELLDPIDTDGLPALDTDELERIELARKFVDQNYQASPTIVEIARQAGLNRNSLYYGFKRVLGVNVSEYIQNLRLEEARRLLLQSEKPIASIAVAVGFKHQSGLTTAFKRKFGITPGQLRRR